MAKKQKVSDRTIRRLARYYRVLRELESAGVERISSFSLAERLGFVSSQIRQDLSSFGQFGMQGYGYSVRELLADLEEILGMCRALKGILIGAGHIGRALATHFCFETYGMELLCAFDIRDPGEIAGYGELPILHPRELPAFLADHRVDFAILTVPRSSAAQTAEWLASMGILAIWNFTGEDIAARLPEVIVENVSFPDSLLFLSFQYSLRTDEKNSPPEGRGRPRGLPTGRCDFS